MQIETLKRGNRYAVRTKSWFGWWYWGYDGCWFTPEWMEEHNARLLIKELQERYDQHKLFKEAKIEKVKL